MILHHPQPPLLPLSPSPLGTSPYLLAQIEVCEYSFFVPLAFLYPGSSLLTASLIYTSLLTVFPLRLPTAPSLRLRIPCLSSVSHPPFIPRPSSSSDLVCIWEL